MTEPRQVLCIGGKHDGEWITERYGSPFIELIDRETIGPIDPMAIRASGKSVYELTQFRVGEQRYWLGVPPGMSTQTAFEMLLRGYGTDTPELREVSHAAR